MSTYLSGSSRLNSFTLRGTVRVSGHGQRTPMRSSAPIAVASACVRVTPGPDSNLCGRMPVNALRTNAASARGGRKKCDGKRCHSLPKHTRAGASGSASSTRIGAL